MVTATRREARAGRALAWLVSGCLALVLLAWSARRGFGARSGAPEPQAVPAPAPGLLARTPAEGAARAPAVEREVLAGAPAPEAPAPARLTGRLQVNGYAARRGRVRLRTSDGELLRELAIDAGGRFFCEALPAGRLLAEFEAEGVFERTLLLPDRFELETQAGELAVLDLDWWTSHVNVVVHSEDGLNGPARVALAGPGYDTHVQVDESGCVKLDVVGQGLFTFRTTTPGGLVGEAELELEAGDDLDTAVLVARIKEH